MNLSAPNWFTAQKHCTVFSHVMQLSLLVLCWKSTLTVILRQNKKKRSLSNVGHWGTEDENLDWHSTQKVSTQQRKAFLKGQCHDIQ